MKAELPTLAFPEAAALAAWVAAQPEGAPGLWLKLAKKGSGVASVTQQEAVDVGLCYGWIDGQMGRFDEAYYVIRFTPRRARSKWSQINRERALQLIADGRMTPRGLAEVERAGADGRWDAAYAPASTATVPDDLRAALAADAGAKALFDRLDGQNRYAILHRIADAKRPETRAARVAKFVAMLARGEAPYALKRGKAAPPG